MRVLNVLLLPALMFFVVSASAGLAPPPGPVPPVHELLAQLQGDFSGLPVQGETRFGHSVAIHGNTLVVGAPGTTVGATPDRGAVFVFRRVGAEWIQTQRLQPGLDSGGGQCGYSVAVDEFNLLIGCPFQVISGMERGRARLYTRSNPDSDFTHSEDFEDLGEVSGSQCGRSVALLGAADSGSFPFAAVACPGRGVDQGGGIVAVPGAVDIYTWFLGWSHQASIGSGNPAPTRFGESIALTQHFGDIVLAVGRPGTTNGQVMIYEMGDTVSDWELEQTYTGVNQGEFGSSVHMRGAGQVLQLAVGAPTRTVLVHDGQDFVNVPVGSVSVAARVCLPLGNPPIMTCVWQSANEFVGTASSGTDPQNRFGHAVQVYELGWFMGGEPLYQPNDPKGRVRSFVREDGEWVVHQNEPFYELPNLGNFMNSEFGASLASISGTWLAVGAPRYLLLSDDPEANLGRGSVFLYGLDGLFSDRFEQ